MTNDATYICLAAAAIAIARHLRDLPLDALAACVVSRMQEMSRQEGEDPLSADEIEVASTAILLTYSAIVGGALTAARVVAEHPAAQEQLCVRGAAEPEVVAVAGPSPAVDDA